MRTPLLPEGAESKEELRHFQDTGRQGGQHVATLHCAHRPAARSESSLRDCALAELVRIGLAQPTEPVLRNRLAAISAVLRVNFT